MKAVWEASQDQSTKSLEAVETRVSLSDGVEMSVFTSVANKQGESFELVSVAEVRNESSKVDES